MENNSKDLSIPEVAQQIENRKIDPKMLDKAVLEKLAVYYKSRRGYKKEDIAEILQVCIRTVERYIANVRSENSLEIGVNFQDELLGEILSNSRLRYQRLWRLSYSDNLSDYEKARTILMSDQIEMNEIAFLSRLGYLSQEQGLDTVENIEEEAKEMGRELKESVKKQISLLNSQQWQATLNVFKSEKQKAEAMLEKMIKNYLVENEKQKNMTGDVAVFTKLYCNIFVINMLHN